MLKILYGNALRGAADGYFLSRSYRDFRSQGFLAVRDGESANTVVVDGDSITNYLTFCLTKISCLRRLPWAACEQDVFVFIIVKVL